MVRLIVDMVTSFEAQPRLDREPKDTLVVHPARALPGARTVLVPKSGGFLTPANSESVTAQAGVQPTPPSR